MNDIERSQEKAIHTLRQQLEAMHSKLEKAEEIIAYYANRDNYMNNHKGIYDRFTILKAEDTEGCTETKWAGRLARSYFK